MADKVFGPRPGKAIFSFWQGIVEIVFRICAPLFGSLPALVAAAVAISTFNSSEFRSNSGLADEVHGSGGFVLVIASLGIVSEFFVIVLRVCNVGLVNLKIKAFLTFAGFGGVFLILGHLGGGIVCALYASAEEGIEIGGERHSRVPEPANALAASAAFCFLSVPLYGLVVLWDIMFIVKGWNEKVVKYSLKETVHSDSYIQYTDT